MQRAQNDFRYEEKCFGRNHTYPMEERDLKRCISQTVTEKTFTVSVRVLQRGEYALQMFAKADDPKEDKKNVCNYLLTSDTGRKRLKQFENAEEKKVRSRMAELAKTGIDLISLEKAIEVFQKHDLDDREDLSVAIDVLEMGRLENELKEAMKRRRLDCLEKAITHASESKYRDKLQSLLFAAEVMRDDLKKLEGYSHDILKLNPSTVAELRRYTKPPQVIHDVMTATFLLLGEKKEDLQYWEIIQQLLSQPHDLIRRVKQFNPMTISAETYAEVSSILQAHTLDSARKASAGAGTFYTWAYRMSEDMINSFASAE